MDMAIDYQKEWMKSLERRFDDLESLLSNNTKTTEKILEQARYTNGKVKAHTNSIKNLEDRTANLESKKGKQLPIDSKTITVLAVLAIVFMVVVVGGKEGLTVLRDILP